MMTKSSPRPASAAAAAKADGAASSKPILSKPKRPLSGYNLYYRYKRNKILEATAHLNCNDGDDHDDDGSKAAIIRDVIAAMPGLEGVRPDHESLRGLSPQAVDELRATTIRREMEGKLFPNENARNRVHRKVHGMGESWVFAGACTAHNFGSARR